MTSETKELAGLQRRGRSGGEARGEIRAPYHRAVPAARPSAGAGGHWRVVGDTFCFATLRDVRSRDVIGLLASR